jgi:nicotinate dehydrogenase subunit B
MSTHGSQPVRLPQATALSAPQDVLHGRVLRPAKLGWDGRQYAGLELQGVAVQQVQALPGVVAVVVLQHYIGVVAVAAVQARQALEHLQPSWAQSPHRLREQEAARDGDESADPVYSCRLAQQDTDPKAGVSAWFAGGELSLWLPAGVLRESLLRQELGQLLALAPQHIHLFQTADARAQATPVHELQWLDAAADAALLSQAVTRPVRVALQQPGRSGVLSLRPRAPQLAESGPEAAAMAAPQSPGAAVWQSAQVWALRPSLARLLSQPQRARPVDGRALGCVVAAASRGGELALTHASEQELDAALVFAQQSLLDEQAVERGMAPLDYRLSLPLSAPERRLLEHMAPAMQAGLEADAGLDGDCLRGRGYATAQCRMQAEDGSHCEVWSAWVAEVAVHPESARIEVTRVRVGHDSQQLQAAQSAAMEAQQPALLAWARQFLAAPAHDDWPLPGGAASASAAPAHEAEALVERAPGAPVLHGQLALDGVLTLPAAAAIANAIFDATGVRLRELPFDREGLRLALQSSAAARHSPWPRSGWAAVRRGWAWALAGLGTIAGMLAMAWPAKAPIAETSGPDLSVYSSAAIARGRQIAAAGDCMVCHTAPGGASNAGGLGLETPFGTIYSTNITPDNDTGIGRWSYAAFERALREGVHRDGRQLYPAFPYTAYAKLSDADIQSLYAFLMAQPPVRSQPPQTALAFPYSLRPALAGWNLLFHDPRPYQPQPTRSVEWNRGAYLVQGAGHCSACHSPRNALGAEKNGFGNYLAGGQAEGWMAPPLDQLASGARPWTAEQLYQYLHTGFSARHGVAAGPMAPVVHGLAELPAADVRAIATYLLDLPKPGPATGPAQPEPAAVRAVAGSAQPAPVAAPVAAPIYAAHVQGERIYQNACAACHEVAGGPTLFGVKPMLERNVNLHSAQPDNLIQVILHGIQRPAQEELGYMPAFKDSLSDAQVVELLGYLRSRFAPQEPQWRVDGAAVQRLRLHEQAGVP